MNKKMDNEAMKAMARRIAADAIESSPLGADAADKEYARIMRMGYFDNDRSVQAALAAIIETRGRDAALAESVTLEMPGIGVGFADGASVARRQIAAAIRSGQQFRKDV